MTDALITYLIDASMFVGLSSFIFWQARSSASLIKRFVTEELTRNTGVIVTQARNLHTDTCELVSAVLDSHTDSITRTVNDSRDAVTSHLTEHANELTQSANEVKAHSKQIIDARAQHLSQTKVQRDVCPECRRTVYKFTRRADGSILRCLDCAAKG